MFVLMAACTWVPCIPANDSEAGRCVTLVHRQLPGRIPLLLDHADSFMT
jgi:hypothetical protein